jgi:hypothetical protein
MEDSVADIELRRERHSKRPLIKSILILGAVSYGVTQDKMKTAMITILFIVLSMLFKSS